MLSARFDVAAVPHDLSNTLVRAFIHLALTVLVRLCQLNYAGRCDGVGRARAGSGWTDMKVFLAAAVGICLLAGTALAFQETGQGGAKSPDKPAPAAKTKPLDLSTDSANRGKGDNAVRIPGLGTLGVLPKLDFGLELLYGEGQAQAVKPRDNEPAENSDGLQIKGTFKHRF